jgi:hypothetical protein
MDKQSTAVKILTDEIRLAKCEGSGIIRKNYSSHVIYTDHFYIQLWDADHLIDTTVKYGDSENWFDAFDREDYRVRNDPCVSIRYSELSKLMTDCEPGKRHLSNEIVTICDRAVSAFWLVNTMTALNLTNVSLNLNWVDYPDLYIEAKTATRFGRAHIKPLYCGGLNDPFLSDFTILKKYYIESPKIKSNSDWY